MIHKLDSKLISKTKKLVIIIVVVVVKYFLSYLEVTLHIQALQ